MHSNDILKKLTTTFIDTKFIFKKVGKWPIPCPGDALLAHDAERKYYSLHCFIYLFFLLPIVNIILCNFRKIYTLNHRLFKWRINRVKCQNLKKKKENHEIVNFESVFFATWKKNNKT